MAELPVSPAYRDAVKMALLLQIVTTPLFLSVLDGGTLAKAAVGVSRLWGGRQRHRIGAPTVRLNLSVENDQ